MGFTVDGDRGNEIAAVRGDGIKLRSLVIDSRSARRRNSAISSWSGGDVIRTGNKGSADGISSGYVRESIGRRRGSQFSAVDSDRGDDIGGIRGNGICFRRTVIDRSCSSRSNRTIRA